MLSAFLCNKTTHKKGFEIMKKIISVILAAMLMMCCLAGCGANGKTLEDVKSAGKLVIATSPDFPPFEG